MPSKPPVFRPAHVLSPEQGRRVYDRERGSAHVRGYGSKWEKARVAFLAKHPLCRTCKEQDVLEPAVVVDHIQPHRGDVGLFWNQANWQSLCKRCHDRKTRAGG
jgi:5-methylcytosine-specific restriction protein A